MALPEKTTVKAQSGQMYDEGFEVEYVVTEETQPTKPEVPNQNNQDHGWPSFASLICPWEPHDLDHREATLRIDPMSVTVHHIEGVQYHTQPHAVRRNRWERRDAK